MSNQAQRSPEDRKIRKVYVKPTIERVNLRVREVMLGACWSTTAQAAVEGNCQVTGCAG